MVKITSSQLNTSNGSSNVATSQTTASTSYTDLTTVQSVTVTVGANGILLIAIAAEATNSGAFFCFNSFALSGANTLAAANDYRGIELGTSNNSIGRTVILTGLTPGSTTVTMKFMVNGGTGTFLNRTLGVVAL